MSQNKENVTVKTTVELKAILADLKSNKVVMAGKPYYAVCRSKVERLDKQVDDALSSQAVTGESANELIDLHDQVGSLMQNNQKLRSLLASAEAEQAKTTASHKQLVDEHKELEQQLVNSRVQHKDSMKELREKLSTAESAVADIKAAQKQPAFKFDPEMASKAEQDLVAARKVVSTLQADIVAAKNKMQQMALDAQGSQNRLNTSEDELKALRGQIAQMRNAMALADGKPGELVFSPTVATMLGPKALEILSKWHSLAFDDVKEKTHLLMSGLNASPSKPLKFLSGLLKQAFEWCKKQAFKARKVLAPWVEMLVSDLASARLRTIQFYRDELKKVIEIKKEHKKQYSKDKPKMGWFEEFVSDAWFYSYAVALRARRNGAKAGNWFWRKATEVGDLVVVMVSNLWSPIKGGYEAAINGESYSESQKKAQNVGKRNKKRFRQAVGRLFGLKQQGEVKDDEVIFEQGPEPVPLEE